MSDRCRDHHNRCCNTCEPRLPSGGRLLAMGGTDYSDVPIRELAEALDANVARLAEAFKIGWHRADELGLPDRTHYGIRAVLAALEGGGL